MRMVRACAVLCYATDFRTIFQGLNLLTGVGQYLEIPSSEDLPLRLASFEIDEIVGRALAEDLGAGDPTTEGLIPEGLQGRAVVVTGAEGVLAGIEVARAVWRHIDPALRFRPMLTEGSVLNGDGGTAGSERDVIAELEGAVSSILLGERTALNFLQRMSGVATLTARYVTAVAGFDATILDTRKTIPGLRALDKYAVQVGGGKNHRRNLGDGVLIKDNHIAAMRGAGLSLGEIIEKARGAAGHTLKIEVEVEDLEQVRQALDAGADILLLDNMSVEQMAYAARLARGRALSEISGEYPGS